MALRDLANLDTLIVDQYLDRRELYIPIERRNRYSIENADGQRLYYATEESTNWNRQCCGSSRSFTMDFVDRYRNVALQMERPFKCWLQSLTVAAPPGNTIGTIKEKWTWCKPKYHIKNKHGDMILYVVGPCCTEPCCTNDVIFKIYSMTDGEVGTITRKWIGCFRTEMTDSDKFIVTFPRHYDVETKALILGATIFIDFKHYEKA